MDANDKTARALYRSRKENLAQYKVIVYRVERKAWRLDDLSVKCATTAAPPRPGRSEMIQNEPMFEPIGPAPTLDAPKL